MFGGTTTGSVTCDRCDTDDRFVEIDVDMTIAATYEITDTSEFDYANLDSWVVTTGRVKCEAC